MPRQRSPKRDKAKQIYLKANGNIVLTNLAKQLNETDGTVRGWKAKDKWDLELKRNGTLQTKETERSLKNASKNSTKKAESEKSSIGGKETKTPHLGRQGEQFAKRTTSPQARFGNKNAVGGKGGNVGPPKNKKALKTGEYETVFFTLDIFDKEEMTLLDIGVNKYDEQSRLIKTLRIREKRMLVRIATLKNTDGGMVFDGVTKNKSTTTTVYTKADGHPGSSNTVTEDSSSHAATPLLKRIMEIEEALTRVQARLQRAIEVCHKMETEDARLAIDHAKLELYRSRITGQIDLDELIGDDDLGLEDDF